MPAISRECENLFNMALVVMGGKVTPFEKFL